MNKVRILGLGQGCLIPSYRYRLQEVKEEFINHNVDLDLECFKVSSYPPVLKIHRLLWLVKVIFDRMSFFKKQKKSDIIILQREMISTLYTVERLINKPFIFDVDDAVHLNQKFNSVNKIARKANAIVVCNQFLADYYRNYNKNVYIIPTPINVRKYKPKDQNLKNNKKIIIGWIGTSSNFKSLKLIEKALIEVLSNNSNVILKIVSNKDPGFSQINSNQYIYKRWSEIGDVEDIQNFDIGIMPLIDNYHSRGRCAFKMLQYMACGIPVVSTCLPMNQQILNIRNAGFCVKEYYFEWIQSLQTLIDDPDRRVEYGNNGVKIIQKYYSTKTYVQKYIDIIHSITGRVN